MSKQYKLETYRWLDGERFCHLLDVEAGLPHQLSLLYVTAKIRNKGLSLSAMQSALNAIHVLLIHFQAHDIHIEQRFSRGKRKSEVLNIQARDIDPRRQQLSIVRRPDSKLDPRIDQPRVKTREHTIAVTREVIQLYQDYLVHRRGVPGASKYPHLLVNHKAGPTQGQPMTKGALEEVFRTIKQSEPRLSHLHPHLLRHHFNDKLSETFDKRTGERNEDEETKVRANLNGWSEQSEMAKVYNKPHIDRKAREAGLKTQETLAKAMKLNNAAQKDTT